MWRHVKPLDFLFYLWTPKSISASLLHSPHSLSTSSAPAPTSSFPQKIVPHCLSCSPIRLFRQSCFLGENEAAGLGEAPQCLPETNVKKPLKFPRILTQLIEISCPIFSSSLPLLLCFAASSISRGFRGEKLFSGFIWFFLL